MGCQAGWCEHKWCSQKGVDTIDWCYGDDNMNSCACVVPVWSVKKMSVCSVIDGQITYDRFGNINYLCIYSVLLYHWGCWVKGKCVVSNSAL